MRSRCAGSILWVPHYDRSCIPVFPSRWSRQLHRFLRVRSRRKQWLRELVRLCFPTSCYIDPFVSTNLTCTCTSTAFQQDALQCLNANCTSSDVATATQLQEQECGSCA